MNNLEISLPIAPVTRMENTIVFYKPDGKSPRSTKHYLDLDIALFEPSNYENINGKIAFTFDSKCTGFFTKSNNTSSLDVNWVNDSFFETSSELTIVKFYNNTEIKNYSLLNNQVELEFKIHGSYLESEAKKIKNIVQKFTSEFSKIKFDDFLIDLSPTRVIRYKFILPNKLLLVVSIPFQNFGTEHENDLVFSFFDNNRECLLSYSKNYIEFVKGLNDYLDQKAD